MNIHLLSLLAFLRDVCGACVPKPEPVFDDYGYRPTEPEPDVLPEPLYHAVVSEMAEALAAARSAVHGDADFAAWSAELMTSEGADE